MSATRARTFCARSGPLFLASAWLSACSGGSTPATERLWVVNGADDRAEYFEIADETARSLASRSLLALIPRSALEPSVEGVAARVPSLGMAQSLCPDERFAEQPAAAFCSGVLVDWDLVLTAGHCAHVLAVKDYVVAFGYYYSSPGELALHENAIKDIREVVRERIDESSAVPRLDYLWLRLRNPVDPPFEPAPVWARSPTLGRGDPVAVLSSFGGVPIKHDGGGSVRDARSTESDYFVADTDTAAGSSGGAAFDPLGALLGIFVRGGTDFVPTPEGCRRSVNQPDPGAAEEQFTYASAALRGLCDYDPSATSLCRADCDEPCRALPLDPGSAPERDESGCSVSGGRGASRTPVFLCALFWLLLVRRQTFAPWRSAGGYQSRADR